jgi:hypothetical protein
MRLKACLLSGLAKPDAGAFAAGRPVGGAFEGDDAVEDTAFSVADLMRVGLPDDEVGRERGGVGGGDRLRLRVSRSVSSKLTTLWTTSITPPTSRVTSMTSMRPSSDHVAVRHLGHRCEPTNATTRPTKPDGCGATSITLKLVDEAPSHSSPNRAHQRPAAASNSGCRSTQRTALLRRRSRYVRNRPFCELHAPSSRKVTVVPNNFVGSWDLAAWRRLEGGTVTYPLGEDATGLLIYTPDHKMAVQIIAANRRAISTEDDIDGDPQERAAAYSTCLAYFGRSR